MELKNSYLHCSSINELENGKTLINETVLTHHPHHFSNGKTRKSNDSFLSKGRIIEDRNKGKMYGYKN